jgi:hypothetical protein
MKCEIFYEANSQLQVHRYTNVDSANNILDRKLTSDFILFF